jgi:hypothetical protein
MICSYCKLSILESGRVWGFHHGEAVAFRNSATQGCTVCRRLAEHIQHQGVTLEQALQHNAAYRWTLRTAAKLRESPEYVILTFRATSNPGNIALSDSVFYVFPEKGP